MIEKPVIVEEKHLLFLDRLRLTGVSNMHGAAQELHLFFRLNPVDAKVINQYWMDSFAERHPEEV